MKAKHAEAMKLALEALKQIDEAMPFPVAKLAQAALREALAEQPAQKRPQNCGTGYCSCIECVVEPLFAQMRELGIETTEHEDPRTFFARVRKLTNLMVKSDADMKPCECVF